ncbi:MAG: hypothetical protein HZB16_10295 [Armatimonadetes bacterium]|nr:hypothetical protein [Armatimonadota bacterium]
MADHSERRLRRALALSLLANIAAVLALAIALDTHRRMAGGVVVCDRLFVRDHDRLLCYLGPTREPGGAMVHVASADHKRFVEVSATDQATVRAWSVPGQVEAALAAGQAPGLARVVARAGGATPAAALLQSTAAGQSAVALGWPQAKDGQYPLWAQAETDGRVAGRWLPGAGR